MRPATLEEVVRVARGWHASRGALVVLACVVLGLGVVGASTGGPGFEDRLTAARLGSQAFHVDAVGDVAPVLTSSYAVAHGILLAGEDITSVAVESTASTVSFRVTFCGMPLQTEAHGVSVLVDTHSALGTQRGPWDAPFGAWIDYHIGVRGPRTTGELSQGPALLARGVDPWSAPRRISVVVDGRTVTLHVDRADLGLAGPVRCFHFAVGSDRYSEYEGSVGVQGGVDCAPDMEIGDLRNVPYYSCLFDALPRDL